MSSPSPAPTPRPLGLFEGFGLELEYMLVDPRTTAIAPRADAVLQAQAGQRVEEVELGATAWSNELALHVLEIKTNGPVDSLSDALGADLHASVQALRARAAEQGASVLPGAMHPTMNPHTQAELWPHGNREIYRAYDQLFDCRGHGWVNLQSCHLNLPFAGDEQLHRLHAAVRALLPLLPALAASSPYADAQHLGALDRRLQVYRRNQARLPSITGQVVPEVIASRADYEATILQPMYAEIAPFDPGGLLQEEWLNSRGAIVRFDRNAIEIRVLDVQETPWADVAIAWLVSETARALSDERWVSLAELDALPTKRLAELLERTAVDAEQTVVDDADLLRALGVTDPRLSAGELWSALAQALLPHRSPKHAHLRNALGTILSEGPLARRMLDHAGPTPTSEELAELCVALMGCLERGEQL